MSKDPIATLKGIYERGGLAYSAATEQHMRAWLDNPAHKSDRYGRYPYSLEPFGLKAANIAATFADYSKRFGLE